MDYARRAATLGRPYKVRACFVGNHMRVAPTIIENS